MLRELPRGGNSERKMKTMTIHLAKIDESGVARATPACVFRGLGEAEDSTRRGEPVINAVIGLNNGLVTCPECRELLVGGLWATARDGAVHAI